MGKENNGRNWYLHVHMQMPQETDYQEHYNFPFYGDCYKEALRCIFLSALREKEQKKLCETQKFWMQDDDDSSNIYAFLGKRGSGKTTAMREFCRILKSINKTTELNWWVDACFHESELHSDLQNTRFYFDVMDPIDASRLEAKEDLFELILARIYRRYEEHLRAEDAFARKQAVYAQKQARERFEKIFRSYHALRMNVQDDEFVDSVIARLQYMSSSTEIKQDISSFLGDMLKEWAPGCEYPYLVIVLDDLDLNIKNGYEMLEQLHKYFWNQRILILLAVDYDQINIISESSFWRDLNANMGNAAELFSSQPHVLNKGKEISNDYIAKVLPVDNRIFMPNIAKLSSKVMIKDEKTIPVKQFLMKKTAQRMHIYYDSCGLKVHFCEPESMRELVSYNQFLDSLYDLDCEKGREESEKLMKLYDRNYERFHGDITERLAKKLLSDHYKIIYEEIIKKDLERRAAYIFEIADKRIRNPKELLESPRDYDENLYGYGHLLSSIYKLGRISDQDKAFIKCVLASFTAEMVHEMHIVQMSGSVQEKIRAKNRLKKFIGKSFSNEWIGEIIPPGETNELFGYGKVRFRSLKIGFPFDKQRILKQDGRMEDILADLASWMDKVKFIPTLECMAMFFKFQKQEGGAYSNRIEFRMEIEFDKEIGAFKWFVNGVDVPDAIIDFMGFVEVFFEADEYKSDMYDMYAENMIKALDANFNGIQWDRYSMKDALIKIIRRQSIFQMKWNHQKQAAFPFYDLDLAYNVMKRVRRQSLRENPTAIDCKKDSYRYIKKAYETIYKYLRDQRTVYDEGDYCYDAVFRTCPFIRVFTECEKNLTPQFADIFGITINNIASGVKKEDSFGMPEGDNVNEQD